MNNIAASFIPQNTNVILQSENGLLGLVHSNNLFLICKNLKLNSDDH